MRRFFGPFSMMLIFGGGLLLGTVAQYVLTRPISINIHGNWEPAVRAFSGAGLIVIGLLIRYALKAWRPARKVRRKVLDVFLAFWRSTLSGIELGSVGVGVFAGIVFLHQEKTAPGTGWPWFGVIICAIVAHYAAKYLAPWIAEAQAAAEKEDR